MPTFYHPAGRRRRRGTALAVAVAAGLAVLVAAEVKGPAASAADIALITAIALVASGIILLGTYLLVRAATHRPSVPPPPPVNVTATVTNIAGGASARASHPREIAPTWENRVGTSKGRPTRAITGGAS